MLLRCLGWRQWEREDQTLSYADALVKTDSENIETTVRRFWFSFAGCVVSTGEKRLPRKVVVFEEPIGCRGYSGGQEHSCFECTRRTRWLCNRLGGRRDNIIGLFLPGTFHLSQTGRTISLYFFFLFCIIYVMFYAYPACPSTTRALL